MASADAGVAPEHLLDGDRERQTGRVTQHRVGEELERVETNVRSLLDDRVGELLLVVPLLAGRAKDVLGEVVDPLLDLQLVFVEREREVGHQESPFGVYD